MRISDWSSDVCSSDLDVMVRRYRFAGEPVHDLRRRQEQQQDHRSGLEQDRERQAGVHRGEGPLDGRVEKLPGPLQQVEPYGDGPEEGEGGQGIDGGGTRGGRGSPRQQDRKSVVEGKSMTVRVDLGGRRLIKKKTNK